MKKILLAICLIIVTSNIMAQMSDPYQPDQNNTPAHTANNFGFNRQSLFVGGTLGVGATDYSFNAGLFPEIGFTVKEWLDVGALLNINYYSERPDPSYYYNYNTRTRSFNYGAGAFARVYPLNFLFVQVEPEVNFISTNYKYDGSPVSTYSTTNSAPSLLLGAGYAQRIAGENNFYIAVLFDAFNSRYSPYRDAYTNTIVPVFKAGFDIYLHPNQ
jgi:hypothetical protein